MASPSGRWKVLDKGLNYALFSFRGKGILGHSRLGGKDPHLRSCVLAKPWHWVTQPKQTAHIFWLLCVFLRVHELLPKPNLSTNLHEVGKRPQNCQCCFCPREDGWGWKMKKKPARKKEIMLSNAFPKSLKIIIIEKDLNYTTRQKPLKTFFLLPWSERTSQGPLTLSPSLQSLRWINCW